MQGRDRPKGGARIAPALGAGLARPGFAGPGPPSLGPNLLRKLGQIRAKLKLCPESFSATPKNRQFCDKSQNWGLNFSDEKFRGKIRLKPDFGGNRLPYGNRFGPIKHIWLAPNVLVASSCVFCAFLCTFRVVKKCQNST